jgi:hypothetical protein
VPGHLCRGGLGQRGRAPAALNHGPQVAGGAWATGQLARCGHVHNHLHADCELPHLTHPPRPPPAPPLQSGQSYAPAITYVAVSKGHPTRLFPAPGDAANVDRLLNVLPGTCVDKQVVSCYDFDFLLVSNASVQVGGRGQGGGARGAGPGARGAGPGGVGPGGG